MVSGGSCVRYLYVLVLLAATGCDERDKSTCHTGQAVSSKQAGDLVADALKERMRKTGMYEPYYLDRIACSRNCVVEVNDYSFFEKVISNFDKRDRFLVKIIIDGYKKYPRVTEIKAVSTCGVVRDFI